MPSLDELDVLKCNVNRRFCVTGNERRKYSRVYINYTKALADEIERKFFPVDERKTMKKLVPELTAAMLKMENINASPANFKWSSNVDNDYVFVKPGFIIKGLMNYDVHILVGYKGEEPK